MLFGQRVGGSKLEARKYSFHDQGFKVGKNWLLYVV